GAEGNRERSYRVSRGARRQRRCVEECRVDAGGTRAGVAESGGGAECRRGEDFSADPHRVDRRDGVGTGERIAVRGWEGGGGASPRGGGAIVRLAGCIACIALASAGIFDVVAAQSVLERPPNLSGGWLGAP